MNETLQNIREITLALQNIAKIHHRGIEMSRHAKERVEIDKSRERREAKRKRRQLAFNERKSGKTFKEVGVVLGVSAGQARLIYEDANRLNSAGFLFPQSHPLRLM